MQKQKIALRLRRIHRMFAVPMTVLVVANISTRGFDVHAIVENITAATMVLMTITGFSLFMLTIRRKTK